MRKAFAKWEGLAAPGAWALPLSAVAGGLARVIARQPAPLLHMLRIESP